MATKTRTERLQAQDTVALTATFRDQLGVLHDLDAFPTISIVDPTGLVILAPTSSGVMKVSTGKYEYDYQIGFSNYGLYSDVWVGQINGFSISGTFNFAVLGVDIPELNSDGYIHLGDDPGTDFSQIERMNINKLLKGLRARLGSRGLIKTTDAFGNVIFQNCDKFSVEQLVDFLCMSLTWFNEVPHFSSFSYNDNEFVQQFFYILIQGATILALASIAPRTRAEERAISDNGISFTPASVSEIIMTEYNTEITQHSERLKFIKNSLKPSALGLSGYSTWASRNPIYKQISHRRQRQIF